MSKRAINLNRFFKRQPAPRRSPWPKRAASFALAVGGLLGGACLFAEFYVLFTNRDITAEGFFGWLEMAGGALLLANGGLYWMTYIDLREIYLRGPRGRRGQAAKA